MTEIVCTTDCPHNTFGLNSVSAFRELDANLPNFVLPYLLKQELLSREGLRNAVNTITQVPNDEDRIYIFVIRKLYHERQDDGKTIYEQWQDAGLPGLTHDQRLLLKYKSLRSPTIVEYQRKIDDNYAEFIDLLEPEHGSLRLLDPMFIGHGYPRFTQLFCYVETYPNFIRLSRGEGQLLVNRVSTPLIDRIKTAAAAAVLPVTAFLQEHFYECWKWPIEIGQALHREQIANLEAKRCTAVYDIGDHYAEILLRLLRRDDIQQCPPSPLPDTVLFDWVKQGKSADFDMSQESLKTFCQNRDGLAIMVIANLTLTADALQVEATSSRKYAFVKERLEKDFGAWIQFKSEEVCDLSRKFLDSELEEYIDDLAARRDLDDYDEEFDDGEEEYYDDEDYEEPFDEEDDADCDDEDEEDGGITPETREQILCQVLDRHYQEFLDMKIPTLQNLTPRQASKDPSLHSALAELMKDHIRQNGVLARKNEAAPYDFNWLLDELDLPELK